uniref:NADH-ubiquinone oxidoreductase chain 4L n=1 Tax=Codonobdella sp. IK-2021 TaxID=2848640 RepID=A0A8F2IW22_9ANNE|nr:NADH dehydrogenase subunit 4L [Codonobdella sp. B45A]QWT29622.1 NADH dehydrogenase subunit 4L [Codonobdella sp. IK-2021]UTS56331.1 NADH dehydrogenase subunit 4L [Codonobdella sp. B45A]
MESIMYLITMMMAMSFLNVMIHSYQFLMTLLSLELLTLSMVMFVMLMMMNMMLVTPSMIIIILTMGACEASLGLSLMVLMTRKFGSDKMKSVSLTKC